MFSAILSYNEIAAGSAIPASYEETKSMLKNTLFENSELKHMLKLLLDDVDNPIKIMMKMYDASESENRANQKKLQKQEWLIQQSELEKKDNQRKILDQAAKLQQLEEELERVTQASRIDPLTQTYNKGFYEEFRKAPEPECYGVFTDLDGFKLINDTFGHDAGDLILQKYAQILKDNIRATDSIYRVGGDEFVVVFRNIIDPKDATLAGEKLSAILHNGFSIETEEGEAFVSASISYVRPLKDHNDFKIIDMEMYKDKEKRKKQ